MKIVTILSDLPIEDVTLGALRAQVETALGTRHKEEVDGATLVFDAEAGTYDVVHLVDDDDMRFGDGVPH